MTVYVLNRNSRVLHQEVNGRVLSICNLDRAQAMDIERRQDTAAEDWLQNPRIRRCGHCMPARVVR